MITVFLDTLGIGLLIPIFPQIMNRFSSNPQIISEHFGIFIGSYAIVQFIASPILGALSDRFGRKIILLCSLVGATLDYLFMAYAPTFNLLIIARIISGLTGASMTVATAYAVDISTEENRTNNFGLVGAAWGVGFIAGPIIGSTLSLAGTSIPFLVAAALNLCNFIFGFFVIPETLKPENRRKITVKRLNPFLSIYKILTVPKTALYVWTYFLVFIAGQALVVNWYLYTEIKFHWTAMQLGISLSFIGVVVAISQGLLTRIIIPKFGEIKSVTIGIFFYVICFLMFSFANHSWIMYFTIILFGLTGVATPALQSLTSKFTSYHEQGELQGSLVSLENLAAVIAPIGFTPLFIYFTGKETPFYFPGVVFFTAAIIAILTLINWLSYKHNAIDTEISNRTDF